MSAPTAHKTPQGKTPAPQSAQNTSPAENPKRGRKPGSVAIKHDLDFGLDFLAAPQLASETEVRQTAPQRERSEVQRTMDAVIPKAHAAWIQAGKPSQWGKLPVVTYRVPPEKVDGLKYLVRRAADFHGVRARFGSAARDASGMEIVAFAVMDKRTAGDDSKDE